MGIADLSFHVRRKANEFFIEDILLKTKVGLQAFKDLSEPYLGGHTLDEAVDRALELYEKQGIHSTLDILGEEATSAADSEEYRKQYLRLMDLIVDRRQRLFDRSGLTLQLLALQTGSRLNFATVSLKPSSINHLTKTGGFFADKEKLLPALEEMVDYARARGLNVTIDMEDHNFTDITLKAARHFWTEGYQNVGIVLQSRLHRTRADIEELFSEEKMKAYKTPVGKMRVRMCIGIYPEGSKHAATGKREMKKRMYEDVLLLLQKGVYVEIATHDTKLLKKLDEYLTEHGIGKSRYEFQILEGVECVREFEKCRVDEKKTVRRYEPAEFAEGKGQPYMVRRLVNNPDLVWNGAKNVARREMRMARNYIEDKWASVRNKRN